MLSSQSSYLQDILELWVRIKYVVQIFLLKVKYLYSIDWLGWNIPVVISNAINETDVSNVTTLVKHDQGVLNLSAVHLNLAFLDEVDS